MWNLEDDDHRLAYEALKSIQRPWNEYDSDILASYMAEARSIERARFDQLILDLREFTRQSNVAYAAILDLWSKSMDKCAKYEQALKDVQGKCPHPCHCRAEGCENGCLEISDIVWKALDN